MKPTIINEFSGLSKIEDLVTFLADDKRVKALVDKIDGIRMEANQALKDLGVGRYIKKAQVEAVESIKKANRILSDAKTKADALLCSANEDINARQKRLGSKEADMDEREKNFSAAVIEENNSLKSREDMIIKAEDELSEDRQSLDKLIEDNKVKQHELDNKLQTIKEL